MSSLVNSSLAPQIPHFGSGHSLFEDDFIHLPSGPDRVACERQEEEEFLICVAGWREGGGGGGGRQVCTTQ